jgi:hypothetical protein
MASSLTSDEPASIDPAYIAEIVRKVLARVKAASMQTQATNPSIAGALNLVTVDTVVAIAAKSDRVIQINRKSIVTPAARDEANRLGVRLEIVGTRAVASMARASSVSLGMTDTTAVSWVESIIAALARRGIVVSSGYSAIQVVLTDCPAKQTHYYSSLGNHRAAMLTGMNQVERFHRELAPNVWVIDKTQVGLPTVVNMVATISRLAGASK